MENDCSMCKIISDIKDNKDPFFVKELETGYVVLSWHQYFNGYTLFICKKHIFELYDLEDDFRIKFLNEMSLVAKVIYNTFKPKKMNYEILGNSDPHLHWHIIPRYGTDLKPMNPIWVIPEEIRKSESARPNAEKLDKSKKALAAEFDKWK